MDVCITRCRESCNLLGSCFTRMQRCIDLCWQCLWRSPANTIFISRIWTACACMGLAAGWSAHRIASRLELLGHHCWKREACSASWGNQGCHPQPSYTSAAATGPATNAALAQSRRQCIGHCATGTAKDSTSSALEDEDAALDLLVASTGLSRRAHLARALGEHVVSVNAHLWHLQ